VQALGPVLVTSIPFMDVRREAKAPAEELAALWDEAFLPEAFDASPALAPRAAAAAAPHGGGLGTLLRRAASGLGLGPLLRAGGGGAPAGAAAAAVASDSAPAGTAAAAAASDSATTTPSSGGDEAEGGRVEYRLRSLVLYRPGHFLAVTRGAPDGSGEGAVPWWLINDEASHPLDSLAAARRLLLANGARPVLALWETPAPAAARRRRGGPGGDGDGTVIVRVGAGGKECGGGTVANDEPPKARTDAEEEAMLQEAIRASLGGAAPAASPAAVTDETAGPSGKGAAGAAEELSAESVAAAPGPSGEHLAAAAGASSSAEAAAPVAVEAGPGPAPKAASKLAVHARKLWARLRRAAAPKKAAAPAPAAAAGGGAPIAVRCGCWGF
jgi:hypothetical protein